MIHITPSGEWLISIAILLFVIESLIDISTKLWTIYTVLWG